MDLDNQKDYWDKVAESKTFTHPVNLELLATYINKNDPIMDYGCGYGRLIHELHTHAYTSIIGYDTSAELIKRGKHNQVPNIFHLNSAQDLIKDTNSYTCILLFAVLTCIPSNKAQKELITLLYSRLKPGGILYISDYYLQKESKEMERYEYLNGDESNFGVFTLTEGATFRHHSRSWIMELLTIFKIKEEINIEVKTMNGHSAQAFQIIAQKPL